MAFITYRGEVPMSPNTMPMVTSSPSADNLWDVCDLIPVDFIIT